MREQRIDAILLTTEPEVRYVTGFFTQFWESPTRCWLVPAAAAVGALFWTTLANADNLNCTAESKSPAGGSERSGEHDDLVMAVALAVWFAALGSRPRLSSKT